VLVLDASVILELPLGTTAGVTVARRLRSVRESLAAPHLMDVEVTQPLRRFTHAGTLAPDRGAEAIADLSDFPIVRYPHDVLLPRMWALRQNATASDAAYIALAEALHGLRITRARRLKDLPGHGATIEVV
jgi:predicted nucleic acid-binding protein